MIKPSSDDYYATTDIVQQGRWFWTWLAHLRQPRPWQPNVLAEADGIALTRKRAQKKADRAAARMMRAADSWTSRTHRQDGKEEQPC